MESKDWTNVLTCYNVRKNNSKYLGREGPSTGLLVPKAKDVGDDKKASVEVTDKGYQPWRVMLQLDWKAQARSKECPQGKLEDSRSYVWVA